jgi:spore coat polysaccharide biosynthesis protein SpsF (cytidylyltransferase family)
MEAPFALGNRNDLRFTLDTNEDFLLHQQLYSKHVEAGSLKKYAQLVGIVDDNPVYRQRMLEQILKNTK